MKMVDVISGTNRGGARRALGFTLIEVMVVVAIIIILVGAVVAVGSNIRASSMIRATTGILQTLQSAEEEYISQAGRESSNLPTTTFYGDLKTVPTVLKILQKLPVTSVNTIGNTVVDPWGNPITFVPANPAATPPVLKGYFFSNGPDGNPNTTDDIRSTEAHQ